MVGNTPGERLGKGEVEVEGWGMGDGGWRMEDGGLGPGWGVGDETMKRIGEEIVRYDKRGEQEKWNL